MDQRTILFLFRILIGFAIDLDRFISCGSPVWFQRIFGSVALKRFSPRDTKVFLTKNVNNLTVYHGEFLLKCSYLAQKFHPQESIVQLRKRPQKSLNKAHPLNNRFCEGKKVLNRIGHVLHVSNAKNMILKAENIPRIGDNVANEKLKPVGTVFDVFGPTSSPYVAVKPNIQSPEQLVNQVLYAIPSKVGRRRRKRR